jgi:hypothetical protein
MRKSIAAAVTAAATAAGGFAVPAALTTATASGASANGAIATAHATLPTASGVRTSNYIHVFGTYTNPLNKTIQHGRVVIQPDKSHPQAVSPQAITGKFKNLKPGQTRRYGGYFKIPKGKDNKALHFTVTEQRSGKNLQVDGTASTNTINTLTGRSYAATNAGNITISQPKTVRRGGSIHVFGTYKNTGTSVYTGNVEVDPQGHTGALKTGASTKGGGFVNLKPGETRNWGVHFKTRRPTNDVSFKALLLNGFKRQLASAKSAPVKVTGHYGGHYRHWWDHRWYPKSSSYYGGAYHYTFNIYYFN